MSESSTLGNRVRELRERAGLSKVKLGKLCGCSQPTLVNIENGRTKQIRGWLLSALAKNLNSTPEWIAFGVYSTRNNQTENESQSFKLEAEYSTEVFLNQDNGISIRQERKAGGYDLVAFSPNRARVVAAKMLAFADFLDGERDE